MNRNECHEPDFDAIFEKDGSLREIYVLDTTIDDWQKLLDFLHANDFETEFYIGRQKQHKLTRNAANLFDDERQISRLVRVIIGNAALHSHCFTKGQIEFDVDPREINDEQTAKTVLQFMKRVGQYLKMPVRLTPENTEAIALVQYLPGQISEGEEWRYWH